MKQRDSCEPSPEKNDSVHEQQNSAESTNPGKDVPLPTIVVPPSPQSPQAPPDKNEARERRTERRDRIRLGVEISAVIVGLIGISGLFVAFRETQETNRIARQTLEVQERPWISVDAKLSTPVTFYAEGGVYVGITLSLENVGHTVAIGISHSTYVVVSASAPVRERNALCEQKRRSDDVIQSGTVLFPERRTTMHSWIHVGDAEDLQGKVQTNPQGESPEIPMIVAGCVTYKSPSDPKRHVTGFMYMIGSKETYWRVPWGKTLPLEDLHMFPHGLADSYID